MYLMQAMKEHLILMPVSLVGLYLVAVIQTVVEVS